MLVGGYQLLGEMAKNGPMLLSKHPASDDIEAARVPRFWPSANQNDHIGQPLSGQAAVFG